jgi:hypothetical protein
MSNEQCTNASKKGDGAEPLQHGSEGLGLHKVA